MYVKNGVQMSAKDLFPISILVLGILYNFGQS